MDETRPTLAVFWGDTRELLSYQERQNILPNAVLESITPSEVLLRDRKSHRIVLVSSVHEKNLFCSLCKTEVIRKKYGCTCPEFARCLLKGHRGNGSSNT